MLVGDFLFARAFELMVEDGSLKVLGILSAASATIAEGEVLQLVTQNDTDDHRGQYLEVIEGKTAALFAAATRVGAVVADRPAAEEAALDNYGRNLGIAFQLVDDALDYAAEQGRWARPSATISARARSPCRCCWPSSAAPRRSGSSGGGRWRSATRGPTTWPRRSG